MNAESTPLREFPNTFFDDVVLELTPIQRTKSQEENKVSLLEENIVNNNLLSQKNGRKNMVCIGQKRKKEEEVNQVHKKLFTNQNDLITYNQMNYSDDFSVNSDEYMAKLLYKVVENSNENSFCANKSRPQEHVEKIQNVPQESLNGDSVIGNTVFEDVSLTKKKGAEETSHLKNETSNKINQMLSTSDVMKWSDESLIPNDSKSNLSNQIIKKLLQNGNNKEIIKSQTTGWTQLNLSSQFEVNNQNEFREIGPFYGLPLKVQKLYEDQKGIKELYSWQKECLNLEAVKLHKNLIYALPTSGGKTLVAEILILRELFCYNRNVLFILPFVSIVQEKIRDFSQFALELGFLVEEYAAGKGVIPPIKRRRKRSVLVATIEKALVVVNSLIEMKRLDEFGLVVVDELHLLSEEGRGAVLETLLTQILHTTDKIQIIGMTATIGNLEEVAKFLKADSYTGNFRPVHLSEFIKCENKIYEIDFSSENVMKEVRFLNYSPQEVDPDGIGVLVQEVIPNDSVLIFCPTKKNCENVALLLCKILPRSLLKHREDEKRSLYKALVSETNDQICPTLCRTIPFGVAYHHSGLTAGERKLLEESFRDGTLSVICCTSTLAAGVNLPAKRVILRSPYIGKDLINLSKYKQMVGRAGRTGFGAEGESYLICQPTDREKVGKLFQSKMDEATSKIDYESCKDLILSAIGLNTAPSRKALKQLLSNSLLHIQASKLNIDTNKMVDACISSLYKQGALKIKLSDSETMNDHSISKLELNATQEKKCLRITNNTPLVVSRLGRAAMKSGMSLEKAHELYSDLIKAQRSLVLLTSLHLLYLVTPYDLLSQIKPNFSVYFNVYMQLDSKEVHTAKIIGITEFVISKLATGNKPKNVQDTILNRFYISLILNELWKQQTIWDVAVLFQLPRGLVQTLMMSASTFANSVLRFCEELEELWSFKSLLNEFAPRLAHCCTAELLPLLELPAVKRGRAKQLYDAGFKTLQHLASANSSELARSIDHLPKRVATQIITAAKLILMEKAENLKEEAEEVLEGLADKSAPSAS